MNRYFSTYFLVVVLMLGYFYMAPIGSYASEPDEIIPSLKTKWALNLNGGYISFTIYNDGHQPVRVSPDSSFSTTTDMSVANSGASDVKYPYSAKSKDDSVIYPAIYFVVKPIDKMKFYNFSDRGGRILEPLIVGPGEEKTIPYRWNQTFTDFAKTSDTLVFTLFYNRRIIYTCKAEHGEGDLLNIKTTVGN